MALQTRLRIRDELCEHCFLDIHDGHDPDEKNRCVIVVGRTGPREIIRDVYCACKFGQKEMRGRRKK